MSLRGRRHDTDAIAEKLLIGQIIGTGEIVWDAYCTNGTGGTQIMQKFGVTMARPLKNIRIKSIGSVNVKAAIYEDNAGTPGTVLAYTGSIAATSGWTSLPLNTRIALFATDYWMAFKFSAESRVSKRATGTATSKYFNNAPYADAFPDSPGSLLSATTDYAISGWG